VVSISSVCSAQGVFDIARLAHARAISAPRQKAPYLRADVRIYDLLGVNDIVILVNEIYGCDRANSSIVAEDRLESVERSITVYVDPREESYNAGNNGSWDHRYSTESEQEVERTAAKIMIGIILLLQIWCLLLYKSQNLLVMGELSPRWSTCQQHHPL
jgi:hypothetical protein